MDRGVSAVVPRTLLAGMSEYHYYEFRAIDIFGLDRDLVAVAAVGDSHAPSDPSPRDIERWLAGLGPDEHVALLSRVALSDSLS